MSSFKSSPTQLVPVQPFVKFLMILPHIAFGLYQPSRMAYESLELKNRIVCVPFQVQELYRRIY